MIQSVVERPPISEENAGDEVHAVALISPVAGLPVFTTGVGNPYVSALAPTIVATVLRPIAAAENVQERCGAEVATVIAVDPIPMCHKISVAPITAGQPVIKYGQSIGQAQSAVRPGVHVHVHNLRSARARAG